MMDKRAERVVDTSGIPSFSNADFIAHSREDLPALLRLVRSARELISTVSGNANGHFYSLIGYMNNGETIAKWLERAEAWLAEVEDAREEE